jgi:hypothetical protein
VGGDQSDSSRRRGFALLHEFSLDILWREMKKRGKAGNVEMNVSLDRGDTTTTTNNNNSSNTNNNTTVVSVWSLGWLPWPSLPKTCILPNAVR